MTSSDSVDLLRKDHTQLAASVSALTQEVAALKTQNAVRDERDLQVKDHLARIEKSVEALYSLLRWFLFAFSGGFIAACVTFIVRGGLNVSP